MSGNGARQFQALFSAGEFGAALRHFEADPSPGNRTPEVVLLAATAAARVGEYELGERLALSVHDRSVQFADDRSRCRALNVVGGIAFERGRLSVAEASFYESAHLADLCGERVIAARAWNNLGTLAHLQGKPRVAFERYQHALAAFESLGDVRGTAQAHHNLGLVSRDFGGLFEAERHVEQAVRVAEVCRDPSLQALTLMGRVEIALARNDLERAAEDVEEAAALAARSGDGFGIAEAHRLEGLVALRRDQPELALEHALKGRVQAQELSADVLTAECAALAALALMALRQGAEAKAMHLDAVAQLRAAGAVHAMRRVQSDWDGALSSRLSQDRWPEAEDSELTGGLSD